MSPHMNLPQKLTRGSTWKGFQIHSEVGSGAMGIVYRARELSSGRKVALKILRPGELSYRKKRFCREVQLAARLDYPGIVRVYKAEVESSNPYLVMQYVDGISFKEYCKRPEVSLEQKLKLIIQVAKALNYTHEQDVLHRDLKPSNILVDLKDNLAYIVDFGLAKTTEIADHRITRTGAVVGTIDYMSPEQAEGNPRCIDHRTDIYSLGVILYELCTERSMLSGDTSLEKLFFLTQSDFELPRNANPNLDKSLEQIILQATNFEKENRYECASFLAEDLEQYLAKKPLIHCLPAWRQSLQKKTLPLLAATAILLLTLIIATLLSQSRFPKIPHQESIEKISFQQHKENLLSLVEKKDREQFLYQAYQISTIPQVEENLWIIEQLSSFGYYSDAYKFLKDLLQKHEIPATSQEKVGRLLLENAFHRKDYQSFEMYAKKDIHENNFIYVRLLRALFKQSAGEWLEAEKTLPSEIYAEEFTPYWRSYYWYVKSRLVWNQSRKNMMSIIWLFDIKDSSTNLLADLKKEVLFQLSSAQDYFQKAYQSIEESSSQQCSKELQQILDTYGQFLHWEKQNPVKSKDVLVNLEKSVSLEEQLWNGESAVRVMVMAKDWSNAEQLASSIIQKAPWNAPIYLLRSIAHAQLGNLAEASQDSIRFFQLSPWEFSYLANTAELLCTERLTQEEYLHYEELVFHYLFTPKNTLENYLFRRSYQSLFSLRSQKDLNSQAIVLSSKWKTFLQRYAHSEQLEEQEISEFAKLIGSLKEKAQRNLYIKDLNQLKRQFSSFPLQKFINTIKQEKQNHEVEKTRRILSVYAPFYKYDTLQEMVKDGIEQPIKILAQIVRNPQEKPAMKMMAATAMANLGHPDAWAELHKISQEPYPTNILATTAMNKKFPTGAPAVSSEELFRHDDFYLIHLCQMIDTRSQIFKEIAEQLLAHSNPRVTLAVCHRVFLLSNTSKTYVVPAENALQNIMESSNIEAKEMAFQVYFNTKLRTMNANLPSNETIQLRLDTVKSYWRDPQRQKTLRDLLNSKSPRLRLTGLLAILSDENVSEYLNSKDAKENPFVKELFEKVKEGYRREKNIYLIHWYLGAILHLDSSGKALDILMAQNLPSYLRSGLIAGIFAKKNAVYFIKILKWIEKKMSGKDLTSLSRSEKMQLQLLIMIMIQGKDIRSQAKEHFRVVLTKKLYPKIVEFMSSSDPETSRVACSIVSFFHKPEVIPLLKKRLNSKNPHLQRAVVTALVHLLLSTKPEVLPRLHSQLKKAKPMIKKAAVMGYLSVMFEDLPFLARYYKNNSPIEKYFWFLHRLKINLHKASEKEKSNWLLAYQYAIELNPKISFFYEKSLIFANQKNFSKAILSINAGKKFIQSRQDNQSKFFAAMLESLRGEILLEQARTYEAKNALQKSIQINPLDRNAYYYLGEVHAAQAEQKERFYWQAYLNGNFSQEFCLSYSQLLFNKGESKKARIVFQRIDRAYPLSLTQQRLHDLGMWTHVGHIGWILKLPKK